MADTPHTLRNGDEARAPHPVFRFDVVHFYSFPGPTRVFPNHAWVKRQDGTVVADLWLWTPINMETSYYSEAMPRKRG